METSQHIGSTIDEFKESLQDYTRTLKAVKSQQSLKNYHANFMKQLRKKVHESQEKHCNQMINSSNLSKFSIKNFELLPVLCEMPDVEMKLKIPLTLCINAKHNFLVKFNKKLKFLTGKTIEKKFLKKLKAFPGYPVCIFKSFERFNRFFLTVDSVKTALLGENREYGYYQEFIKPTGGKASILITHAKSNSHNKHYLVHNNDSVPKTSETVEDWDISRISRSPDTINLPLYLKEEIERTKKVKFLNSEPKSTHGSMQRFERFLYSNTTANTHKSFQSKKSSDSHLINPEKSYIVNPRNAKFLSPYLVKIALPEIEVMTQAIFSFLSQEYKKKHKKDVEEMHLIYIKDQDRGWYFLKVDSIEFFNPKKVKELNKSSLLKSRTPPVCGIEEFHLPLQTTLSDCVESSFNLSTLKKPKIRVRFCSNIKAKSSFHTVSNTANVLEQNKIKLMIDRAALKYDIFTKVSKICPQDMQKLNQKYGAVEVWAPAAVKIHKNLVKSSLQPFFIGFNRDKLKRYERSIEKILCCKVDYQYKKEMQIFHKGFSISNADYDLYRKIFSRCVKKIVNDEKDFELVMINFDSLREYIVEIE